VTGDTAAQGQYGDPKTYRDEWRAEHDLDAQRLMAWWTRIAAIAAGVGVVLLAGTLWEATRTAIAAAGAAAQSRRSADIAEQALRGLERPYLFVEISGTGFLRTTSTLHKPRMYYSITNYGKLPAIMRSLSISLRYNPTFPLLSTEATADESYAVVRPGKHLPEDDSWQRMVEVKNVEPGEDFYGNKATLLIFHGILEYEDPTGAYHVDSFCLRGAVNAQTFRIDDSVQEYNWHRTTYPERQQDNQS
jgi:hypothetical protein